jgi:hypothetical protein
MPAIRAVLFVFVLLFDLRRRHGLREGQREGAVEASRLRDAAFPDNLSLEGP